jgi:hypothetical protein
VNGTERTIAQGQATINTAVNTLTAVAELDCSQNAEEIKAVRRTNTVKRLLITFEKLVKKLSVFLLKMSLFHS